MTETSQMNLKILYTLDDGSSGTYLARSKKPQRVTVVSIPHPSSSNENDSANFNVGAVDLSPVLQEIYLNSPELLNHNVAKSGHDYNLYYRDICEVDEPLVSLGLLSQIRFKLRKQLEEETTQNEEYDEDESFIVTGRVCSNFAALLKRSYSNMAAKNTPDYASTDTLEVKLRFIRMVTQRDHRRPSATTLRNPASVSNQQQSTSKPGNMGKSGKIRPVKGTVIKRHVNQTPAQKAERTQSLPIWNPKQTSNTAFPANSIAHKIYLADRKTDATQQNSSQQPLAYQINALQQDNTIQKFKVDDSVSKRFDFMLNKKKSGDQSQSKGQATRKPLAAKARRFNTMASIPVSPGETNVSTPKENPRKRQRSGSDCDPSVAVAADETCVINDLLTAQSEEKKKDSSPTEENKENRPPLGSTNEEFDLDLLPFADINSRSDLEWFGDFNLFNSPSLNVNGLAEQAPKPSSTTPKDPNTCNTISIENAEEDDQAKLTSDIDRTSPIDTLSMPLMELNERSTTRLVSCHEQLRRLPLLSHQMKVASKEGLGTQVTDRALNPEEDGSILVQLSSSCQELRAVENKNGHIKAEALTRPSSPPSVHEFGGPDDCDEDEDGINENTNRQRTIPSSPTTMFNYQDELSSTDDAHDLFSSFIRSRPTAHDDADSTPATQYDNYSNENSKA